MRKNDIPSMLQYVLGEQGRSDLAPEETALVQASSGLPIMVAGNDNKRSWLQKVFGTNREGTNQPRQLTPAEAAAPAEGLAGPGSIADQIRKRRQAADAAGEQASMVPDDYQLAANDTGTMTDAMGDRYGGVSAQTRAGMDQLGRGDPTGEFGDAIIGKPAAAAPGGYAAKTTVRGKQTSAQENSLVKMLVNQGMSDKEARARARSIK